MATTLTFNQGGLVIPFGVVAGGSADLVETMDSASRPDGLVDTSLSVVIYGADQDAVQITVNAVERLLAAASRNREEGAGERVYAILQMDNEGISWRSEVLGGELQPSPKHLGEWVNDGIRCTINLLRRGYWEGSKAEIELSSAASPTFATGGKAIDNANDGTYHNYIDIEGESIEGVLPSPLHLRIENTSGGSKAYRNFYISNNAFQDPGNFMHVIEASGVVDASSSGGEYQSIVITTTATLALTLTAAQLQRTQGRRLRILARITGVVSAGSVYVQARIADSSGLNVLALGDEVLIDSSQDLWDLGSLPFPPGGYHDGWGEHKLLIYFRATASATVLIDFLQVTPMDSYRFIRMRSGAIADGDYFEDDGISGVTHAEGNAYFTVRGDPLMAFPGVDQRLYILHDLGSTAPIDSALSIRAWYRPRRLTV